MLSGTRQMCFSQIIGRYNQSFSQSVSQSVSYQHSLLRRIVLSANSARRELYSPASTNTALRLALFAEYSSRTR